MKEHQRVRLSDATRRRELLDVLLVDQDSTVLCAIENILATSIENLSAVESFGFWSRFRHRHDKHNL